MIDSMLIESAKLQSIKEDLLYDIIQLKLQKGLLKEEDMTEQEKYIVELKKIEKEKAALRAKQRKEAKERERAREVANNLKSEFMQYAGHILY